MALTLPNAPKFEKRMHHVVPAAWQKRFALANDPGPYYRNIVSGKNLPAQGPGDKMAEEYVNIVFDEYFRPSDSLEDRLSSIESAAIQGLDRVVNSSRIDISERVDIAYFLAIQACRYPEHFGRRLDLGRYLAIALKDSASCPDVAALNRALQSTGMLPGATLTAAEFDLLKQATEQNLALELEAILRAHGYEAYFNPELIIAAALPVAEHLLALDWCLMESKSPAFILSDRPVPSQIKYGFRIGLSAKFGLVLSKPTGAVDETAIQSRPATTNEIDITNGEVRARALTWICGPGSWVHSL
jgi:hypothetical protein